jgi:hypothetical protein
MCLVFRDKTRKWADRETCAPNFDRISCKENMEIKH